MSVTNSPPTLTPAIYAQYIVLITAQGQLQIRGMPAIHLRVDDFVFTSLPAVQMFFGHCQLHHCMKKWPKLGITPPGFYKYARTLELSLSPDFPALVLCANHDLPGIEHRHHAYDFHWLRLNQFQKLHTLNIWTSAQSTPGP